MQVIDNTSGFFVTRSNPLEIFRYDIDQEGQIKISNIIDLGNPPKFLTQKIGDVECWDFKYSKKYSLGFLLVNSGRHNRLFFFNKKLQFKEFGKKLSKLNYGDGRIIKFNRKQSILFIRTLPDEITVYRNLKNFEESRQAFKYSKIPINLIKDYFPFRFFNKKTKKYVSCLLTYSSNGALLWMKLNRKSYEIFFENNIPLENGEVCKAADFAHKDKMFAVSTAKGEKSCLHRLILFKLSMHSQNELDLGSAKKGYNEAKIECYFVMDYLHIHNFEQNPIAGNIFSHFSALSFGLKIGGFPVILGHQREGDNLLVSFAINKDRTVELLEPVKYHEDVMHRFEDGVSEQKYSDLWSIDWNGDIRHLRIIVQEGDRDGWD